MDFCEQLTRFFTRRAATFLLSNCPLLSQRLFSAAQQFFVLALPNVFHYQVTVCCSTGLWPFFKKHNWPDGRLLKNIQQEVDKGERAPDVQLPGHLASKHLRKATYIYLDTNSDCPMITLYSLRERHLVLVVLLVSVCSSLALFQSDRITESNAPSVFSGSTCYNLFALLFLHRWF